MGGLAWAVKNRGDARHEERISQGAQVCGGGRHQEVDDVCLLVVVYQQGQTRGSSDASTEGWGETPQDGQAGG